MASSTITLNSAQDFYKIVLGKSKAGTFNRGGIGTVKTSSPSENALVMNHCCLCGGGTHFVECNACSRSFCTTEHDNMGCVSVDAFSGPWKCPGCTHRSGQSADTTVDSLNPRTPLLTRSARNLRIMVSMGRHGKTRVHFQKILKIGLQSFYNGMGEDSFLVSGMSLGTSPSVHIMNLIGQLKEYDRPSDFLWLIDTHSDSGTGNMQVSSQEGLIYAMALDVLANLYYVDEIMGATSGFRGVVVISCGATMSNPQSLARHKSFLKAGALSFLIGFSAPALVPAHITLHLCEIVKKIYVHQWEPQRAVEVACRGNTMMLTHTGVVLLTPGGSQDDSLSVRSQVFVYGPLSLNPWGLGLPRCPKCQSNNIKTETLKTRDQVKYSCTVCRLRCRLRKPEWVEETPSWPTCWLPWPRPLVELDWYEAGISEEIFKTAEF